MSEERSDALNQFEALLAALPVAALPGEVDARLVAALLAARPRPRAWWQRSVPLWQAAAAALVLAALTAFGTYGRAVPGAPGSQTQVPVSPVIAVQPAAESASTTLVAAAPATGPQAADSASPGAALDIRRWQVLAATVQGGSQ